MPSPWLMDPTPKSSGTEASTAGPRGLATEAKGGASPQWPGGWGSDSPGCCHQAPDPLLCKATHLPPAGASWGAGGLGGLTLSLPQGSLLKVVLEDYLQQ